MALAASPWPAKDVPVTNPTPSIWCPPDRPETRVAVPRVPSVPIVASPTRRVPREISGSRLSAALGLLLVVAAAAAVVVVVVLDLYLLVSA